MDTVEMNRKIIAQLYSVFAFSGCCFLDGGFCGWNPGVYGGKSGGRPLQDGFCSLAFRNFDSTVCFAFISQGLNTIELIRKHIAQKRASFGHKVVCFVPSLPSCSAAQAEVLGSGFCISLRGLVVWSWLFCLCGLVVLMVLFLMTVAFASTKFVLDSGLLVELRQGDFPLFLSMILFFFPFPWGGVCLPPFFCRSRGGNLAAKCFF